MTKAKSKTYIGIQVNDECTRMPSSRCDGKAKAVLLLLQPVVEPHFRWDSNIRYACRSEPAPGCTSVLLTCETTGLPDLDVLGVTQSQRALRKRTPRIQFAVRCESSTVIVTEHYRNDGFVLKFGNDFREVIFLRLRASPQYY